MISFKFPDFRVGEIPVADAKESVSLCNKETAVVLFWIGESLKSREETLRLSLLKLYFVRWSCGDTSHPCYIEGLPSRGSVKFLFS